MINKGKVVLIFSGGIDSTTLLYKLLEEGYNVNAVSFDYCQKHGRELVSVSRICNKLGVPYDILNLDILNRIAPSALTRTHIDVPQGYYNSEDMKSTVVPNRNMVFISLATTYAIGLGASKVYYGAHKGDHTIYPDCRVEFIGAMREAIRLAYWDEIILEAPFQELNKSEIVALGLNLGVPYINTWSCYVGSQKPCMKCGTCVERTEAFLDNQVKDPLLNDIEWEEAVKFYLAKVVERGFKK